jgi:hypothetical protein
MNKSVGIAVFLLKNQSDQSLQKAKTDGVRLETRRVVTTHLLLNLQLVDDRRQLRENLVSLLMVLELCGNEVREVAERLGGVEDLDSQQLRWGIKQRYPHSS